jgi:hypothetical protein
MVCEKVNVYAVQGDESVFQFLASGCSRSEILFGFSQSQGNFRFPIPPRGYTGSCI